jgi:DNA polymerase (family X)
MDKAQVVEILEEIGVLLELQGENPFKTRAYTNAARVVETLSEDLGKVVAENRLGESKGIGEALQQKITELVTTGKLGYYEKLRASFPPGLLELLKLPGLGPKKVRVLYDDLKITNLTELESACREHRLASLKGFGEKTELNILAALERYRSYASLHRYGDVLPIAEEILDYLRQIPELHRVSVAGSLRRGKEITKDIDLVASASEPSAIMSVFVQLPGVIQVVAQGETKSSIIWEGGIGCDLRVVADSQFSSALHHFTGSKEHNVAMRQRAIERGFKLSEWGLFPESTEPESKEVKPVSCPTEEALFSKLGLQYIPPELRENLGEIEAASENKIPRLLEWTQLCGTFHNHTTASDGQNTLEQMAEAAQSIGLSYLGIADHSKSSFQANGLDETHLLGQIADIRRLNKTYDDFQVFAGSEVDVLKDGRLDYDDEILSQLDYVVASVHSVFNLDEEMMTKRIIRAMENPFVTMLGHATGRLLLARESYAVNLSKIIDCAAETGTWIELNSSPWRFDLDWRWWHKARDKGVFCSINPDAHSVAQLGYIRLGATMARKGWLRSSDVVNTLALAKMRKLLQTPKAQRAKK